MRKTLRKVLLSVSILGAAIALPSAAFALDTFEPNNNFGTAFSVVGSTTYSSYIPTPNDLDYYKVAASAANTTFTMQPPAGKNYNIYIYNGGGVLIAVSANPAPGALESVVVPTIPGNSYFMLVRSGGADFDALNPYKFKITP